MAYDKQNLGRVCYQEFGRISRELGITGRAAGFRHGARGRA